MADAFASFYKNVHKEPRLQTSAENTYTFLTGLNLPTLPEKASKQMMTPITETEKRDAINRLKATSLQESLGFLENSINAS